ncbi:hypothetical protein CI109_104849 [Kwoniella shandongensis]|uniref:U3 small nucleolar RNA-associated protein 10 n=1 Tax=Kwoniella shandongensis TaxID=1734106 RepID=A0A5M6BV96_9TREE|nr:uncharacterized protein CI109_006166 [Kwoniella shandongensis]KAA5525475.1 hypothetical protein CI109_006166 [Kwoniella shandongensis]
MSSSLASQLQQIASLDASRLTSKYGTPSSKSYLFPPKVAAEHDLDSIFTLAQSGFDELLSLDPGMEVFEDELFSERAKRTDRMMLSQEENDALNTTLGRCLRRLGKWVGVMAGGKCIEWLVRRFRIHEMNAETLLLTFLPYHSSPNFARILAILTLPKTSPYFAPFSALIAKAQPVPRSYITSSISPSRDKSLHLLGDVAGLVKQAIKEDVVHRALLTFWTATMVDLMETGKQGKGLEEGLIKLLVETFVVILETPKGGEDVNAAVYPPLVLLTRSITIADGPFQAIVSSLLTPSSLANPSQRMLTLLVILNDRPTWNSGLGVDAPVHLAKIKQLGEILVAAMEKYGFETALKTVVSVLLERPDLHNKSLAAVLEHGQVPNSVAQLAAKELLQLGSAATSSDEVKTACKTLLANLRERHPSVVDSAFVEASSRAPIDHALVQKPVDEVAFLNIYAADVSSRVQGVREVFDLANSGTDQESAVTAIIARLGDDDEVVIEALYQNSQQLSTLLSVEKYIAGVKPTFWSVSPKPAIIGHHLDYISNHLLVDRPKAGKKIFRELLFPVLLSTEKRQPLTKVEALKLLSGGLKNVDILGGIVPEIAKARAENTKGGVQKSNLLVATALSEATATSTQFEEDVSYFIGQLDSANSSARLLAYMVLTKLITSLQGDLQLNLAVKALEHLRLKQNGPVLRDIQIAEQAPSPALLEAIHRKADDGRTTQRAVVELLSSLVRVVKPATTNVTWLSSDATNSEIAPFKVYSEQVYIWANSGLLPAAVSSSLLRSLLTQLGEEALLFFASLWTSSSPIALRTASLRHATAFVSAYSGLKTQQGIDFQIVIPALLIALQDGEKVIRQAGVELLKALSGETEGTATIYALDAIYGDRSDVVQLLKSTDRRRYLDTLLEVADEIIIDAGRVKVLHSVALEVHRGQNKKSLSHRRAVIGCLTSHIVAFRSLRERLVLLDLLSEVQDSTLLRGVLPLLTSLENGQDDEFIWLSDLSFEARTNYLEVLFGVFKPQAATVLAEEQSPAWTFLLSMLAEKSASPIQEQLRKLSLRKLADGVFAALPVPEKIEYVLALIQSLHTLSSEDFLSTKEILGKFELDSATITELIDNLSEPLETTFHRKKQRHDDTTAEEDGPTAAVHDLTVLIESRDWKSLPGDAGLVASLMSILSSLLTKRLVIKEGVDYLEQEVLAAILALVEKIEDPAEVNRAHVGIEVVIKVIRASTNPRTSQRALLVAAELARLIPDAVLHNVMPIFTFMGASDFQRDDAYSFGVVEKTVTRIVPVMTKSLKDKATSTLDLYNESLTFLSIFTDMSSRLPKHRTLPFFVHLVKSLDPVDFLAPVCMLLVDRATTKGGRAGKDVGTVLELPAALAATFDVSVRTEVLLEIVNELGRLVGDLTRVDKEAFLSRTITENDSSDRPLRQITYLLNLATALINQLRGKSCAQVAVQSIVRQLIILAAATSQPTMASTDIPTNMHAALEGAMQLLSAENFLGITLQLLGEGSQQDKVMSLTVFTERVPLIKSEIRSKNTKTIGEILKSAAGLLGTSTSTISAALIAIKIVTKTALPVEDGVLAQIVPAVVGAVSKFHDTANTVGAFSLIELLVRHLGSRVIPYIQSIVDVSLTLIKSPKTTSSVSKQAFTTLASILETVSTFISSKQLTSMIRHTIDYRSKDASISLGVFTTIAKRIRTKTLFPVLMELWKIVQMEDEGSMKGFFDLLRLTLKNATREDLPGMIKPVFAFFLDVFDLRHRLQGRGFDAETINDIEESAIGSFLELVTKLNEATFKPLFIRLYDWAVIDLAEGKAIDDGRLVERKIVLLHVMMGLLVKFKNLLSPYIATLLPHIQELLPAYASGEIADFALWKLLLEVLGKSFEVDEGAFYTDSHLLTLIPLLIAQLPLFPTATTSEGGSSSAITRTLSSLAGSTTSEKVLRTLNTSICLATRSDEIKTRLAALRALDGVWERQTEEMLTFVPETVSEFLAELLEDESGDVEAAARKVLDRIEKVTGSLKEYLE